MTRWTCCSVLLLGGALLITPMAVAQPARNGNVYNGTAHQPTAGGVGGKESATGVAPPQQQTEQENHDLDAMGRQLTDKAKGSAKPPPTPRPPNPTGR